MRTFTKHITENYENIFINETSSSFLNNIHNNSSSVVHDGKLIFKFGILKSTSIRHNFFSRFFKPKQIEVIVYSIFTINNVPLIHTEDFTEFKTEFINLIQKEKGIFNAQNN